LLIGNWKKPDILKMLYPLRPFGVPRKKRGTGRWRQVSFRETKGETNKGILDFSFWIIDWGLVGQAGEGIRYSKKKTNEERMGDCGFLIVDWRSVSVEKRGWLKSRGKNFHRVHFFEKQTQYTSKGYRAMYLFSAQRSWAFILHSLAPDHGFESQRGTDHYGAEQS
jgi:hypothetical protein